MSTQNQVQFEELMQLRQRVRDAVDEFSFNHAYGVVHIRNNIHNDVVVDNKFVFNDDKAAIIYFHWGLKYVVMVGTVDTFDDLENGIFFIEIMGDADQVRKELRELYETYNNGLHDDYLEYIKLVENVFEAVDKALKPP